MHFIEFHSKVAEQTLSGSTQIMHLLPNPMEKRVVIFVKTDVFDCYDNITNSTQYFYCRTLGGSRKDRIRANSRVLVLKTGRLAPLWLRQYPNYIWFWKKVIVHFLMGQLLLRIGLERSSSFVHPMEIIRLCLENFFIGKSFEKPYQSGGGGQT